MTKWHEVDRPVAAVSRDVDNALATLEPLRHAWREAADSDPAGFRETRLRTLRSHAIETGIIERLYDVSWGVTEALVAEGLAMEVAQGVGNLNGDILAIINDQYEALEHVSDLASRHRDLSVQFIRELHQIITRHQLTYEATDSMGRITRPQLIHGEWKKLPNHIVRPNGEVLECTPPERVQDQMESLVRYYNESADVHPIIRGAWLHHSFMCIHPFDDGNGRVGRALLLLDLISGGFAPLVVGRDDRERYLAAIDIANEGPLDELVIVLAELERQSMVRQFQAPLTRSEGLGVIEVAKASSVRLRNLRIVRDKDRASRLASLSRDLAGEIFSKLQSFGSELQPIFVLNDQSSRTWVSHSEPGDSKAKYHHGQLVQLARSHDFYANLAEGSWWVTLTLSLLDEQMRFLAAIVKVGAGETGVAAMLVQAERRFKVEGHDDDDVRNYEWLFDPGTRDQVPFTYDADYQEIWNDIEQVLDRALAAAIAKFTQSLG